MLIRLIRRSQEARRTEIAIVFADALSSLRDGVMPNIVTSSRAIGQPMPFFSEQDLDRLIGEAQAVDQVLDLVELDRGAALLALEKMLAAAGTGAPRSLAVRFAPASPGSGETLFLPVGRRLLEARKLGVIDRFAPLPTGDGFVCQLPGDRSAA